MRAYVTAGGLRSANGAMRSRCSPELAGLPVPVTLAWGELDRLVRGRARPCPDWRTIVLHGCGHIPTWDDPSQVARALLLASA